VRAVALLALVACGGKSEDPTVAGKPSRVVVAVDRRVELMSAIFRRAGRPRYAEAQTPYAKLVDALPGGDAVTFTQQLGVGFEMAPTLAVQLDDQLAPRVPLDPLPAPVARWKVANVPKYLAAVRAWAPAFDKLFASQRAYFDRVETADRAVFDKFDVIGWYDGVFGAQPQARYHLVPGLLTGPMDYAARSGDDIYVIAHLDHPDADGVPAPTDGAVPFVVHELGHTYTNPIVNADMATLETVAMRSYGKSKDKMRAQAYGKASIVVEESVVRAIVVLWVRDRWGNAAGDREIAEQEQLGFTWIRALADALAAKRVAGKLDASSVTTATYDVFARER
jgi:uncharacterized protein DUF4932